MATGEPQGVENAERYPPASGFVLSASPARSSPNAGGSRLEASSTLAANSCRSCSSSPRRYWKFRLTQHRTQQANTASKATIERAPAEYIRSHMREIGPHSSSRLYQRVKELGRLDCTILSISAGASTKGGRCRFSRMCLSEVAPGMTATFCCSAHRSSTCALDTLWRSASSATTAESDRELAEPPSEPYAVTAMPLAWHQRTSWKVLLGTHGWNSSWCTAGRTPVSCSMCSIWLLTKLETPRCRTLPAACASIRPRQTSTS
mmetsp:Transcript_9812/g.26088  ORF Transcript_9812/g.26088 Transcript_9812/m.26088 type:complete len:262 (+) Transcript_9812:269-1054(+)